MGNVRFDGAVVINAPRGATVTLIVALTPCASVMTIAVAPLETPVMVKDEPSAVDAVATAALLLAIW